jgi:hypothetical protein
MFTKTRRMHVRAPMPRCRSAGSADDIGNLARSELNRQGAFGTSPAAPNGFEGSPFDLKNKPDPPARHDVYDRKQPPLESLDKSESDDDLDADSEAALAAPEVLIDNIMHAIGGINENARIFKKLFAAIGRLFTGKPASTKAAAPAATPATARAAADHASGDLGHRVNQVHRVIPVVQPALLETV